MTYKNPKQEAAEEAGMIIDAFIKEKEGTFTPDRLKQLELLKGKIELLALCPCSPEGFLEAETKMLKKKKKGQRQKTERENFMSQCMRSSDKGGESLSMADCATAWKLIKEEKEKSEQSSISPKNQQWKPQSEGNTQ